MYVRFFRAWSSARYVVDRSVPFPRSYYSGTFPSESHALFFQARRPIDFIIYLITSCLIENLKNRCLDSLLCSVNLGLCDVYTCQQTNRPAPVKANFGCWFPLTSVIQMALSPPHPTNIPSSVLANICPAEARYSASNN